MITSYRKAVRWLYARQALGIKVGLDNIRLLCGLFDNPHMKFKAVHIAGTNGKGSVLANLKAIGEAAGLNIGTTTSPHLVEPTERFTANGQEMSRKDFTRLTRELVETVACYNREHPNDIIEPTYYEATIVMAFRFFVENKVDLALVETGLGGRLDSTNILTPLISVITSISMDHMEYLGDKLTDIAREKGGIIKPGVPVVCGMFPHVAKQTIDKIAKKKNAPIYRLGFEIALQGKNKTFSMQHDGKSYNALRPGLVGAYQQKNAALAVVAAHELGKMGFPISEKHIRKGLAAAIWPGRLHAIDGPVPILLDCAHNPEAVDALVEHLASTYKGKKLLMLFGAMADKDYPAMIRQINSKMRPDWIVTRPYDARAEDPKRLAEVIGDSSCAWRRERVRDALYLAMKKGKAYDLVVIAGSIFLVGEIYRLLGKQNG